MIADGKNISDIKALAYENVSTLISTTKAPPHMTDL
jgi:hypothetical protein